MDHAGRRRPLGSPDHGRRELPGGTARLLSLSMPTQIVFVLLLATDANRRRIVERRGRIEVDRGPDSAGRTPPRRAPRSASARPSTAAAADGPLSGACPESRPSAAIRCMRACCRERGACRDHRLDQRVRVGLAASGAQGAFGTLSIPRPFRSSSRAKTAPEAGAASKSTFEREFSARPGRPFTPPARDSSLRGFRLISSMRPRLSIARLRILPPSRKGLTGRAYSWPPDLVIRTCILAP